MIQHVRRRHTRSANRVFHGFCKRFGGNIRLGLGEFRACSAPLARSFISCPIGPQRHQAFSAMFRNSHHVAQFSNQIRYIAKRAACNNKVQTVQHPRFAHRCIRIRRNTLGFLKKGGPEAGRLKVCLRTNRIVLNPSGIPWASSLKPRSVDQVL